ncbi:MAG: RHS repeat-associated core domain-containing protein, partial [Polyangiaceae bacterium]
MDQRDGKGVEHQYGAGLRVARSKYFEHFKVRYDYLSTHQVRVTTPDGAKHTFWNTAKRIIRENGNGTTEALSFDAKDRLCARACWQKAFGHSGLSWSNSYRYDAAGNLVARMDTHAGPDGYEYDADNRLIAHQNRSGTYPYAYDAAGNLVRTARLGSIGYAAGNLLSRADFSFYTQDSRFRRATKDVPGKSLTEYSYDSLDQLNKVRLTTDGQQKLWCAGYDGLGRRVWREVDGKRTDFYWDGDRLAAERSPYGKLRLYVYPNEDALVPFMWLDYASDEAPPESGQAFYLFADPSGMPVRVEDAAGMEVWRAESIDPYGEVHGQDGAECPARLRFAGHFYDEELGLFYNRFRDYDPQLGRYLQPDRLGHAGGLNLFAYSANPLVEVDLRGLAHRKDKNKKSESADTEEKPPSTEKTQQEIQAERLKEVQAAAQKTLYDVGPIGPKARAELEAMPGGKELMNSIDNTSDPMKKLEQTQVAAVAIESQRSGDTVSSIEKPYPKSDGGELTR